MEFAPGYRLHAFRSPSPSPRMSIPRSAPNVKPLNILRVKYLTVPVREGFEPNWLAQIPLERGVRSCNRPSECGLPEHRQRPDRRRSAVPNNLANRLGAFDADELLVETAVKVGQPVGVKSQLVENRRVQVFD